MLRRFPLVCSLLASVGSGVVAVLTVGAMSPATAAATDWATVDSGYAHTCAIRVGKLYCWGWDGVGQLGNGGINPGPDVASPQQITTATDWKTVSAGTNQTCAIRSIGKLYCWGSDNSGQVGNGSASDGQVTSPQQITTATDWTSVSAGNAFTCAIRSTGKLYCWGSDDVSQIGNGGGSSPDVASPQQITSATDWKTVTAGANHACATRGKLYCWGQDGSGQVGNGSDSDANVDSPQQITGATDWKTVTAGTNHTCATRGKLYCWGQDQVGQLGNGTDGPTTSPAQITAATDWKTVSASNSHTCATRGKLYCWGDDAEGQLGNGTDGPPTSPAQITAATDWTGVSVGNFHTCATRGKLYCWGGDGDGQLGNGAGGPTTSPTQI